MKKQTLVFALILVVLFSGCIEKTEEEKWEDSIDDILDDNGEECGGWSYFDGGEFICECDGELIKNMSCPPNAMCDGGTYYCTGKCGECELVKPEPSEEEQDKPIEEKTPEQNCIEEGGKVSTLSCCKSAGDFPNQCLVGACGCAPDYSHEVKICQCGASMCFNGTHCTSWAMPYYEE
ncbi:MAG: hypothetical protein ABIG20_00585 [archaeon]